MTQKYCVVTDQEAYDAKNGEVIIARLNVWTDQFKGQPVIIKDWHDPISHATLWYVSGYDSSKWTGR